MRFVPLVVRGCSRALTKSTDPGSACRVRALTAPDRVDLDFTFTFVFAGDAVDGARRGDEPFAGDLTNSSVLGFAPNLNENGSALGASALNAAKRDMLARGNVGARVERSTRARGRGRCARRYNCPRAWTFGETSDMSPY